MTGPFIQVTDARAAPARATTWINLANVTRIVRDMAPNHEEKTVIYFVGMSQAKEGDVDYDNIMVNEKLEDVVNQLPRK